MSLERVDPFALEDRFSVDHLLRYAWVQHLAADKRVLDIACGCGFGSVMLAHANASCVLGVDADAELVAEIRGHWQSVANLQFEASAIESLAERSIQPFELAICFETLEHVADPGTALDALKACMQANGLLVASVPGETDHTEYNPFHLHHFDAGQLQHLFAARFRNTALYRQRFHVESVIEKDGTGPHPLLQRSHTERLRIDLTGNPPACDTFLIVASDADLPQLSTEMAAASRHAWLHYQRDASAAFSEVDQLHAELKQLHRRYQRLFGEHGDLQRKFTNMLGWGKFHYEQLHGQTPQQDYLQGIEAAGGKREQDLRATVLQLQDKLAQLSREHESAARELAGLRTRLNADVQQRRKRFAEDAVQP